jgi:hypothetical protein
LTGSASHLASAASAEGKIFLAEPNRR